MVFNFILPSIKAFFSMKSEKNRKDSHYKLLYFPEVESLSGYDVSNGKVKVCTVKLKSVKLRSMPAIHSAKKKILSRFTS